MTIERASPLRPAAVIFDLDGTLADSFAAIADALDEALREVGMPGRGLEWTASHVGRGAEALVRDALAGEDDADRVRAFGRRFGEIYRASYLEATPPVPGALTAVAWVAGVTGRRVAVVSNKQGDLCQAWLERYGFAPFIAAVSGPDRSGARKPDPAAVLPVLARLGVAPAQALMVGDMAIDLETAGNAGMLSVAVMSLASAHGVGGPWAPGEVLASIGELPAWLAVHGEGWPDPAAPGDGVGGG